MVIAIVGLLVFSSVGLAWALSTEEVRVDGGVRRVHTFRRTVKGVLVAAGVELGAKDRVDPPLSSRLARGQAITVYRAIPLTVEVDNRVIQLQSSRPTALEVLAEAGIAFSPRDRVEVEGEQLKPAARIRVVRVEEKLEVEQVPIPHGTVHRSDPGLEVGLRRVVQRGRDGLKEVTRRVIYENGTEVGSTVINEKVLRPPVSEVLAEGTVNTLSRGGRVIRFRRAIEAIATAYNPGRDLKGNLMGERTAIGLPVRRGMVAVDPGVIPLHSRLYVEGYGFALAADIGSAIKGNRIDVFVDSLEEALRWGRRRVKVYILEE